MDAKTDCISGRGELRKESKAQGIPDMNTFEASAVGDQSRHTGGWVVSHDSECLESWELIESIRRCDRATVGPFEGTDGGTFSQQMAGSTIDEIFLEAMSHRGHSKVSAH
jgi:hypothetical protein